MLRYYQRSPYSQVTAAVDVNTLAASKIIFHFSITIFRLIVMDLDSKHSHLDPPPPYAESIADESFVAHSLPSTIQKARFHRISSLLATHIHPHLPRSALDKVSSRTLVLIPSNVSGLQPIPVVAAEPGSYLNPFDGRADSKGFINESVIGFPSTENLMLIRLHGDENTLEFWQQENVIQDLETQLEADLIRLGHRVMEGYREERMHRSNRQSRATSDSAEWRAVTEQALGDGEVRVSIRIKEVSLRVQNVMGLYETRGGKAVVVRVEFGGC